jgi:DNA-binding GntR family transcriptional regulator
LYRRWSGAFQTQQAPRDVSAEHRGLMDAALDRNADLAARLLTDHINNTAALLERYVAADRSQPDAGLVTNADGAAG